MTTEEMIYVMNAYTNGKKIEFRRTNENNWNRTDLPLWDWAHFDYRVKPEPKYVPYDSVEEVEKDRWFVAKTHSTTSRIAAINNFEGSVYLSAGGWKKLDILFSDYVYEDGSPCGKQVCE